MATVQWRSSKDSQDDMDTTQSVIQSFVQLELWWYQNPTESLPSNFRPYVASEQEGGSIIQARLGFVKKKLIAKHQRYSADSSANAIIDKREVRISGDSATVVDQERFYQVLLVTDRQGKVTQRDLGMNSVSEFYSLVKKNGNWLIFSSTP